MADVSIVKRFLSSFFMLYFWVVLL
jgi:hypothetical protein